MATINDGDEVVIPAPYWVSYPDITQIAGESRYITRKSQNNYKISADQLDKAITDKTNGLF